MMCKTLLCFQSNVSFMDISQEAVGQAIRRMVQSGGIKLPEGLKESDKLPEPIYTPSTKAEIGDHDENISFERSIEKFLRKNSPVKDRNTLNSYAIRRSHFIRNVLIMH